MVKHVLVSLAISFVAIAIVNRNILGIGSIVNGSTPSA